MAGSYKEIEQQAQTLAVEERARFVATAREEFLADEEFFSMGFRSLS